MGFVKPIPVSLEAELQGLRLGVGGSNLGAVLLTKTMLFSTIALHLCVEKSRTLFRELLFAVDGDLNQDLYWSECRD